MQVWRRTLQVLAASLFVAAVSVVAQDGRQRPQPANEASADYILGPNDQFQIWALGAEEISDKVVRVDPQGDVDLPLIGKVHAGGLSVEELKSELIRRLREHVKTPQVTVTITQYQSQPVSLVGAVANPGIQYLNSRKLLLEVLSMGGGLRTDAGHSIRITRQKAFGTLPLANAQVTEDGRFSVGDVKVTSLIAAGRPQDNIVIMPNDVVSVPRAEMVYVIGEVRRAGGIVLGEKETLSVLQALSMAEGMSATAAPSAARILRNVTGQKERTEIPVNIKRLLARNTTSENIELRSNDILFIPSSATKKITARAIEAGVGLGTGILIWR